MDFSWQYHVGGETRDVRYDEKSISSKTYQRYQRYYVYRGIDNVTSVTSLKPHIKK